MTYELVAANTLNTERIQELRAIYEGGYAAHERAPWSRIDARLQDNDAALALVRDDSPVGFALLRGTPDTNRAFVRYLAIDPAQRGHDLGARFWQLLSAFARDEGYRQLVWVATSVDDQGPGRDEGETRPLRIGFLERAGGALVPVGAYTDDHAAPTDSHAVPMGLVATVLGEPAGPIDSRALRRLALDVYAYRYELAVEAAGVRTSIDWVPDD